MKYLNELVQIVKTRKLSLGDLPPMEKALYDGITNELFDSESAAVLEIFGERKKIGKYRMLKQRLKKRLYATISTLTLSADHFSDYVITRFSCEKQLYIVRILFLLGAKENGEQLAKSVILKAQEFHLTNIVLECAILLRQHYAQTGARKEYLTINDLLSKMLDIQRAELRAEELSLAIIIPYVKSASKKGELLPDIKNKIAEIDALLNAYPSHRIRLEKFRAHIVLQQVYGNQINVIEESNTALHYLKKNPHFELRSLTLEFLIHKLNAYIFLEDYVNARFTATLCTRYSVEGKRNWFNFQEQRFILTMRLVDLASANAILHDVFQQSQFNSLSDFTREKWEIFNAYYVYAALQEGNIHTARQNFDVNKLIQRTPQAKKDKKGWNISVIIIQILFALYEENIDALEDKLESLKMYCLTYLHKNDTYRSQVMIRMLLLVAKESGDYKRVQQLGRSWLQKLRNSPQKADEAEVIPYEVIWEWVLEKLQSSNTSLANRGIAAAHGNRRHVV